MKRDFSPKNSVPKCHQATDKQHKKHTGNRYLQTGKDSGDKTFLENILDDISTQPGIEMK